MLFRAVSSASKNRTGDRVPENIFVSPDLRHLTFRSGLPLHSKIVPGWLSFRNHTCLFSRSFETNDQTFTRGKVVNRERGTPRYRCLSCCLFSRKAGKGRVVEDREMGKRRNHTSLVKSGSSLLKFRFLSTRKMPSRPILSLILPSSLLKFLLPCFAIHWSVNLFPRKSGGKPTGFDGKESAKCRETLEEHISKVQREMYTRSSRESFSDTHPGKIVRERKQNPWFFHLFTKQSKHTHTKGGREGLSCFPSSCEN